MMLSLRAATDADIELLARMNKQLIDDECHSNPVAVPELAERMRGWLHAEWSADLFVQSEPQGVDTIIGYALYQRRQNEFFPGRPVIYLRQFLIVREHRGRGQGRRALKDLIETRLPSRCTLVVDVLTANTRGLGFWQRVGFQPYQMTLKAFIGD